MVLRVPVVPVVPIVPVVPVVSVVPMVLAVPVVTMVSCDGGTSYEAVLVVACCGSGILDDPVPLPVLRLLLLDVSPAVAPDVPNTLAANKN